MLLIEIGNFIASKILDRYKGQSIICITLNKKVISDISNQIKVSLIIVSINTANYYNYVPHFYMSFSSIL